MSKLFSKLALIVDTLKGIPSTLEKIEFLSKYRDDEEIQLILALVYSSNVRFGVTSATLRKNAHLLSSPCPVRDLITLLKGLSNDVWTGHQRIAVVNSFIAEHKSYEELIWTCIDKNLKIRMDERSINKALPDCVFAFDVALAEEYDPDREYDYSQWFVSRKLDGVRVVAIIKDKSVHLMSREGNEFKTLSVLEDKIRGLGLSNVVLDGEVGIFDEEGIESFSGMQRQILRKDYTIPNPVFSVFDALPYKAFLEGTYELPFSERLQLLPILVPPGNDTIRVLNQTRLSSVGDLQQWQAAADENGWEGLILRKDVPYVGKRSTDMLKVKKFKEAEFDVIGTVNSFQSVVRNGRQIQIEMLSAVTIMFGEQEVQVGSGWNQEQRIRYGEHPEELVGRQITVRYFEATSNKRGTSSLRFPTVKAIHEERGRTT